MDNEILEIQNLNDDDLLQLYEMLDNHIKYLKNSVIDNNNVEIEEESEAEARDE